MRAQVEIGKMVTTGIRSGIDLQHDPADAQAWVVSGARKGWWWWWRYSRAEEAKDEDEDVVMVEDGGSSGSCRARKETRRDDA